MRLFLKFLSALSLLLLIAGCGGSGDSPIGQATGALRVHVTTIALDTTQRVATITVTITNTSRSTVTLGSANAAIYEVEIEDTGGKSVWNYGLLNVKQPTQVTLAPGELKTFALKWYAEDNQGKNVITGRYLARAALLPQTINGAALSASQKNALPVAFTTIAISTPSDRANQNRFQPGVVLFGMNAAQDTVENRSLLLAAGTFVYTEELHDGVMTLSPGVSAEAGIAFLQTYAFLRFAELNIFITLD